MASLLIYGFIGNEVWREYTLYIGGVSRGEYDSELSFRWADRIGWTELLETKYFPGYSFTAGFEGNDCSKNYGREIESC
jgi:hypothetical protein